jgi:hypothetical protein
VADKLYRPQGAAAAVNGGSLVDVSRPAGVEQWQQPLRLPSMAVSEVFRKARCQRVFAAAHTYHINSVSVNSDQVCESGSVESGTQCCNACQQPTVEMHLSSPIIVAARIRPKSCRWHLSAICLLINSDAILDGRHQARMSRADQVFRYSRNSIGPRLEC